MATTHPYQPGSSSLSPVSLARGLTAAGPHLSRSPVPLAQRPSPQDGIPLVGHWEMLVITKNILSGDVVTPHI